MDQDEQEKIAKAGAEMKLLTNEMDAETDKWNGASDENNDIVKRFVVFFRLLNLNELCIFVEQEICQQWHFRCINLQKEKEI